MNAVLMDWYLKNTAKKAAEVTDDMIKEGKITPQQALMLTQTAALIELDKTLENICSILEHIADRQ